MTFTLFISIVLSLFSYNYAKAETVLVPDNNITFEEYQEKCKLDGYQCTYDYFLKQTLDQPTPKFDLFIDSVDTTLKSFNDSAAKSARSILETESINLEQVELLVRVLEQTELPANKALLKEIQFLTSLIKTGKASTQVEEYLVVFKQPVSPQVASSLKKSYLQVPIQIINFKSAPASVSSRSLSTSVRENLVQGTCDTARLANEEIFATWKILSNENCGWSQSVKPALATVYNSAKKNRNWIYTGALILGAAVLASQYEVQFSF